MTDQTRAPGLRAARMRAQRQRARKKRLQRQRAMLLGAALFIIVGAAALIWALGGKDAPAQAPAAAATQTPAAPSAAPTVAPPVKNAMLPILSGANTPEKRVAITIDDLNQPANLDAILDLCQQNGARVTLFVLGSNVNKCSSQLLRAHTMGMEIENHTYDHEFVYKLEDDELIYEVRETGGLVSKALGVNYKMHFLRPPGGNGRDDPRLHALLTQADYKAVAHWSLSGTGGVEHVLTKVKPGDVILYHTTDKDVVNLTKVIPYLAQMGYEMVTLNELFGYEANECAPYDESAPQIASPITVPYSYEDMTFAVGTRMYGVKLLQNRLIALGYLAAGNADGDYGNVTSAAIKLFQAQSGLTATGDADPATREALMREDAPHNAQAALSVK